MTPQYPGTDVFPGSDVYPEHPYVIRARAYEKTVKVMAPAIYLPLDDAYAAGDLSGNNRDGAAGGGLVVGGREGALDYQYSACADLDGVDDRISTTYAPFTAGAVRTFWGWAWRNSSAAIAAVLGGDGGTAAPALLFDAANQDVLWRVRGSTTTATSQARWVGAWPGLQQWSMFTLIFDEAADSAELYVGQTSMGVVTGLSLTYAGATGNLKYGARSTVATDPFDGRLCQVGVWERALAPREIRRLYKAGLQGFVG